MAVKDMSSKEKLHTVYLSLRGGQNIVNTFHNALQLNTILMKSYSTGLY